MYVLYPLSRLYDYGELRYSLRSLKNIPHGKVIVAGEEKPKWLTNVEFIQVKRYPNESKGGNQSRNVTAGLQLLSDDDDFILMNDDFFIMEPLDELPVLNYGRLDDVIAYYKKLFRTSVHIRGMEDTKEMLVRHGVSDPISYELHVPMTFNKGKYTEAQTLIRNYKADTGTPHLHIRTVYGNLNNLGGSKIKDVKVTKLDKLRKGMFLSTDTMSFAYGVIGGHIKSQFKRPSEYELP